MSRKLSYIFPAANNTDVCQIQTLGAAGALTLNGNLADPVNNTVSFIKNGYSRQISLSSIGNLSIVNFTITGIQNGISISETIAGPNNTTIYSAQIYDVVTSITTNGLLTVGVSVGSGWKGFFKLITVNLWPRVINYTLSVTNLIPNNRADIAVYGTIDEIQNNGKTFLANLPSSNPAVFFIVTMGVNAPYLYSNAGNPTYSSLLVQIGSSAASLAYPMELNFIQQQ